MTDKCCVECKHYRKEHPEAVSDTQLALDYGPHWCVKGKLNPVTGVATHDRCENTRYMPSSARCCGTDGWFFEAKEATA